MTEDDYKQLDAIKNALDQSGDLAVEVLYFAFNYIKHTPTASIQEALNWGLSEWVK